MDRTGGTVLVIPTRCGGGERAAEAAGGGAAGFICKSAACLLSSQPFRRGGRNANRAGALVNGRLCDGGGAFDAVAADHPRDADRRGSRRDGRLPPRYAAR